MTAVYIYDLAASEVADRIGHLGSLSSSTSPTSTAVSARIVEVASQVNALLRSKGMDPALYTSSCSGQDLEIYHAVRGHIADYVAAKWYTSNRNQDGTLAQTLRTDFLAWISTLAKDPSSATGDAQGEAPYTNCTSSNARDSAWSRTTGYR